MSNLKWALILLAVGFIGVVVDNYTQDQRLDAIEEALR